MKKRGIVRPEFYTKNRVFYSDRKGHMLVIPRKEGIAEALRVTYESVPVQKPEGRSASWPDAKDAGDRLPT